ncbi:MAG: HlyD family type I secretion periplasmic adaptor subunit [Pseudomonadota bacterium]
MASKGVYDNDDLHFMPDVHKASLRRGRRFAYLLTTVTLLFFVVMAVWSHYAVLDEVTRGEGSVVPSSKTQVIQNLEGGILAEILVREGDIVEKGDILVRINNTAAQATYRDWQSQYWSLLAEEARMEAEIEGSDEIQFSETVRNEAPQEVRAQERLFNARKRQLNAQVSVLESQASQRKQEIAETTSRKKQQQDNLRLAKEELNITAPLVQQGVLPRLDLIRIERQIADFEGEIDTLDITVPRLETALAEAEHRVEELVLSSRAEVSDELQETRSELASVRESLFANKDRVSRTEVRSQVRGTVKELKHNTIGGVIQPGEDIIEIVPLDDTLLIEAQVRPADIAFLRPGQEAVIKVSAYDYSIYGGLEATLEQISAGTIRDEEGESFYRVYLRTKENALERYGEDLPIIPGMTATAEILTGKKTVLDYLLKPILKARDRALRER